jgi:hypothetical protein
VTLELDEDEKTALYFAIGGALDLRIEDPDVKKLQMLLVKVAARLAVPDPLFPARCEACGVPLLGGATVHKEDCAFLAIIRREFPNHQR